MGGVKRLASCSGKGEGIRIEVKGTTTTTISTATTTTISTATTTTISTATSTSTGEERGRVKVSF